MGMRNEQFSREVEKIIKERILSWELRIFIDKFGWEGLSWELRRLWMREGLPKQKCIKKKKNALKYNLSKQKQQANNNKTISISFKNRRAKLRPTALKSYLYIMPSSNDF